MKIKKLQFASILLSFGAAYVATAAADANLHSRQSLDMESAIVANQPAGIDGSPVTKILATGSGSIYVATARGLVWKYSASTKHWYQVGGAVDGSPIYALVMGTHGDLYAGTADGGVFKLNVPPELEQKYHGKAHDDVYELRVSQANWQPIYHGKASDDVFDFAVDNNGNLYSLFVSGEICVINPVNNKSQSYPAVVGKAGAKSLLLVGNDLYVGLTNGEVMKSNTKTKVWKAIFKNPQSDTPVWSLAKDQDNNLYAGNESGNVYRIAANGSFKGAIGSKNQLSNLDSSRVWWMVPAADKTLYVVKDSGKIYKFNQHTLWQEQIWSGVNNVWSMTQARNGMIYIGTNDSHVYQLDNKNQIKRVGS